MIALERARAGASANQFALRTSADALDEHLRHSRQIQDADQIVGVLGVALRRRWDRFRVPLRDLREVEDGYGAVAIDIRPHDRAVQQRILRERRRRLPRVRVAVAIDIVVAGVAERVGARAISVRSLSVRLRGRGDNEVRDVVRLQLRRNAVTSSIRPD